MERQWMNQAGSLFPRLVLAPFKKVRESMLRRLADTVSKLLSEYRAMKPAVPLCVGLAYDPTSSERLKAVHVERIVSLCRDRECRLAFTSVGEIATPLQVLRTQHIAGGLTERLRAILKNEFRLNAWRTNIAPAILTNRRPARRDLYGALLRLELLFAQNNHVKKLLIVISDCTHTGPERLLPPFTGDVTILVVGAEHDIASWVFGENVITLDDMESALEILKLKTRSTKK